MISQIQIQDFRSIEDVTVELSPVTALVGRSGTGKSNFVSAIQFLRDCLNSEDGRLNNIWPFVIPAFKNEFRTSFNLLFEIPGVGGEFEYSLTLGNAGPNGRIEEEFLCLDDEPIFHQQGTDWMFPPRIRDLPPVGQPCLGKLPAIQECVIAYSALTTGIGCYEFPSTVLYDEKTLSKYANRVQKNQQNDNIGLVDDAHNYLSVWKAIASNLQDLSVRKDILSALRVINPTVENVDLDNLQHPQEMIVSHEFGDELLSLKLAQESDGFRRYLAHLMALHQQPAKQTLIFEEPENGIYPGALSVLAEQFLAIADSGRSQVILTTQSPSLVDYLPVDSIRVVELHDRRTVIGRVSQEQREAASENLLTTGEPLTVDPARAEAPGA
jgi:ABC-type branched-subunit amino acid transport system ATPase component